MWSVQEMFYSEQEPVWILKPEKGDKKKGGGDDEGSSGGGKGQKGDSEYTVLDAIPYYPYYYPDYVAPAAGKADKKDGGGDKKEKTVVLKVPICCGECEETIHTTLGQIKGVKSVDCNTRREKVTVVVTTAAPADVLLACRNVFRSSRMWSDDD